MNARTKNRLRAPGTMKVGVVLIAMILSGGNLMAQFSAGSDGSDGALSITVDTVLDLPMDGIFNHTTITIAEGATLRFNRNARNTPVYLLASEDVLINGAIDVSGGIANQTNGGLGGPGGFNGGQPGLNEFPPGAGLGPGGGLGGEANRDGAGPGAYLNSGTNSRSVNAQNGTPYGTPLLIPMVGGSGGGGSEGSPGFGGGGGGGGLLIASDTLIEVGETGRLLSRGGSDGDNNFTFDPKHGGSGGGIRLVSPIVRGTGTIDVTANPVNIAGDGRIRVDAVDRRQLNLTFTPIRSVSVGVLMTVFPQPTPRLDVLQVAGQDIPEGTVPANTFILPVGLPAEQTIRVQARNFQGLLTVVVRLIPENGSPVEFEGQIDMNSGNPASSDIPVVFPLNIGVNIQVWSKED